MTHGFEQARRARGVGEEDEGGVGAEREAAQVRNPGAEIENRKRPPGAEIQ